MKATRIQATLVLLLTACQDADGPVDDMLVEYDRFIEDQYIALTEFREANDIAPLTREEYDDYGERGYGFRWAQGSPRRECLLDASHGDKYRDYPVWQRLIDVLVDEDDGSMRWGLTRISVADTRYDLDEYEMNRASVETKSHRGGFPWMNCGYLQ